MMLPGYQAQNWCLEVEWEREADQPRKGFLKVNELFSFMGANDTQIDEVWLLVYFQDDDCELLLLEPPDEEVLAVVAHNHLENIPTAILPNPLPIVPRTIVRPPPRSKYFAIFVRDLNPSVGFDYVNDDERPFLVGYYVLEPNMTFSVPACSLLYGAPDIATKESLNVMGYEIRS